MKIAAVSEMRAMDRGAIEHHGIPEEILMENAGMAVCRVIEMQTGITGRKFIIFCGAGNNGGDGLVIARKLFSEGASVKAFLLGDREKYAGAASLNLAICEKASIPLIKLSSAQSLDEEIAGCDAIIDAIFGTGLVREVAGIYAEVIERINKSGKIVFAVDIPSGINGDDGRILGTAVKAAFTVTFGLPKLGNMLFPGFSHCGRLYVSHISFPPLLYDSGAIKVELNEPFPLPPRDPAGHKGSFGDVLFIAGASSYYGAPSLAAASFLKTGGGYARLSAPSSMVPFLAGILREAVYIPLKETPSGSISLENRDVLIDIAANCDMVVLGPGVSLDKETQGLVRILAREISRPLLIDGDALTALAGDKEILKGRSAPTVLTPHPGEMARLSGCSTDQIAAGPITVLKDMCSRLKSFIVLKGAHSLIGSPDGRTFINMTGNSGMATPGAGDVLTGAIAAMHGLGLPVESAVRNGVFVHGLAGDLAAAELGEDGMIAGDIAEKLPAAVTLMRKGTWRAAGRYDIEKAI